MKEDEFTKPLIDKELDRSYCVIEAILRNDKTSYHSVIDQNLTYEQACAVAKETATDLAFDCGMESCGDTLYIVMAPLHCYHTPSKEEVKISKFEGDIYDMILPTSKAR